MKAYNTWRDPLHLFQSLSSWPASKNGNDWKACFCWLALPVVLLQLPLLLLQLLLLRLLLLLTIYNAKWKLSLYLLISVHQITTFYLLLLSSVIVHLICRGTTRPLFFETSDHGVQLLVFSLIADFPSFHCCYILVYKYRSVRTSNLRGVSSISWSLWKLIRVWTTSCNRLNKNPTFCLEPIFE